MENSIFIFALVIALSYLFFRFLEMRFILKENKPLKFLFRDAIIVYLSVLLGNFILEQVQPLQNLNSSPNIFTGAPDF